MNNCIHYEIVDVDYDDNIMSKCNFVCDNLECDCESDAINPECDESCPHYEED